MNRSIAIGDNNQSFSRSNISAMDISTNKVVEEKGVLEKKYVKLKEDYLKLKSAYSKVKESSLPAQPDSSNPEFDKEASGAEINRLRSALSSMEREKDMWKDQASSIASELRKEKDEGEKVRSKLERKINELSQEVEMSRKNTDVMNRSQHLSM